MSPTMRDGRQANSERRRQRVATAIRNAAKNGTPIGVSAIARQAGVDRTFLYRHRDLLELVHAAEREPGAQDPAGGSPVSRASLQADLANAQARNTRLAARVQQLEKRLSQALGAQAWQESGLGAPADIDELQRKITRLEQHNVELTSALEETRSDLDAAREANRDLTRALNQRS
ncbi:DUF6262 family protein [Streptomyces sp. AK010]|uniref:DUF6262 family protein n=1 Tax=Streptomyces sp. AK010 TaxID=2723074 RepID=UPI0017F0D44F|nr:DUF6262 family protein [Streptomyces sp. AK010]MBB6414650.1 cell division protein FtsB [Streptomyces sp. AK010]